MTIYSMVDQQLAGKSEADRSHLQEAERVASERLKKDSRNPDLMVNLAKIQLFSAKVKESRQSIQNALLARPGFERAMITLAQIEFSQSNLEMAEVILNNLGKKAWSESQVLMLRGHIAMRKERVIEAISLFRRAVDGDPSNVAARMNVAVLYLSFAQFQKASLFLQKVLQDVPDHLDAKLYLAVTESVLGQHERAAQLYKELRVKGRSDAPLDFNQGLNHFKMGQLDESRQALQTALKNSQIPDRQRVLAEATLQSLKSRQQHSERLAAMREASLNEKLAH